MCLAVPVQVLKIPEEGVANVEHDGVKLEVSSVLVEDLKVGDYCLVHAGFIIEKLTPEVAAEKLDLFKEFYEKTGRKL